MKVIFVKTNETKEVSLGYAVNYLIPQGLAVRATEQEIQRLANWKIKNNEAKLKQDAENEKLIRKYKGKEFELGANVGEKGKLFGAITKTEIAGLLGLNKNYVLLKEPIRQVGKYKINLKFGNLTAAVNLTVKAKK